MTAPVADILVAGRTLATLAEPGRDLDALGLDIREVAETLKLLGQGMRRAQQRAEETHDDRCAALAGGKLWDLRQRRPWTRDEVDLARDNELKRERETAIRTAKAALVQLQALIVEMERQP